MDVPIGKGLDPALMKSMQFIKQAQAQESAGELQKAVLFYQAAAKTCPANGLAYKGLLALLLKQRDYPNVGQALRMVPQQILQQSEQLRYIQGVYLLETNQVAEALAVLEPLRSSSEVNHAGVLNNIGTCFSKQERYPEAIQCYQEAQAAGLDVPELWANLACALKKQGDYRKAEEVFRQALAKYPDDEPLRYEYGLCLLTDGQYERGFEYYRSRWGAPQFAAPKPKLPLPELTAPDASARVLVVAEQGIGDQILYAAGLPALQSRVASLGLIVEPRLQQLMARSFPDLAVHTPEALESDPSVLGLYDGWMSAADVFCHVWEDIGKRGPYLKPDEGKVAAFRAQYQQRYPGKRLIGLSWKSKRPDHGDKKSVAMQDWRQVLDQKDCVFICLQYGDIAEDIVIAREELGVEIVVDDAVDLFNDIDGIAALSAALDGVVTTSNSAAHIAAAVGVPLLLLAPAGVALLWYWGHQGKRCDWYPNVQVFRPSSIGDWQAALAEVAGTLIQQQKSG